MQFYKSAHQLQQEDEEDERQLRAAQNTLREMFEREKGAIKDSYETECIADFIMWTCNVNENEKKRIQCTYDYRELYCVMKKFITLNLKE